MTYKRNFWLIIILCKLCALQAQNKVIDSLTFALKNAKADTLKVAIITNLSWAYRQNSQADSALLYANMAEKICHHFLQSKKITGREIFVFNIQLAKSFYNIGIIYQTQGHYYEALDNFARTLDISKEIEHKKGVASALKAMATVYHDKGDYPNALKMQLQALKINEAEKFKSGLMSSYNGIGKIYYELEEYDNSLAYYFKAVQIAKKINEHFALADCYNNIGLDYWSKREDDSSIVYYLKSIEERKKTGSINGLADTYCNIANYYRDRKDIGKAIEFYNQGLQMYSQAGNRLGIGNTNLNLAKIYFDQKNYKRAETLALMALSLGTDVQSLDLKKLSRLFLSRTYEALNDYSKALVYYKDHISARDSLSNEENTKKIVEQQMQFDFDKKEATTKAEQDKKDLLVAEEKQKHRIIIASVSSGLGLVFVLALVILRSLRQNQKKNKIISDQKTLVEHQKELVEEKQKEILDSIYYARRIQKALITSEKYIDKNLKKLTSQ